ncbi:MAG: hypothetical protein Q4G08_10370, partial [Capnocytophaga sp.]|nr:hypothetical protein [Capnocytophaga sp.]
ESSYKINESKNLQKSKDKLRGEIVEELKGLKIKREHGLLTAADSLRIEFLYHQYQKINE